MEVRNRFKGLDLIDRVPEELWTEVHDIVQETGSRPSSKKRNAKNQNGCLRSPVRFLGQEDSLVKGQATYFSVLGLSLWLSW